MCSEASYRAYAPPGAAGQQTTGSTRLIESIRPEKIDRVPASGLIPLAPPDPALPVNPGFGGIGNGDDDPIDDFPVFGPGHGQPLLY